MEQNINHSIALAAQHIATMDTIVEPRPRRASVRTIRQIAKDTIWRYLTSRTYQSQSDRDKINLFVRIYHVQRNLLETV